MLAVEREDYNPLYYADCMYSTSVLQACGRNSAQLSTVLHGGLGEHLYSLVTCRAVLISKTTHHACS